MPSFETAWTPEKYRQYVETSGHTPTQDPVYNHSAGSPASSRDLERNYALNGSSSVTPETQRSYYGLSNEQRDAFIQRYPTVLLSKYAIDHFEEGDLKNRIEEAGLTLPEA